MNTKVYVEGGILIMTPYFKYKNAGALYAEPPKGSEIITPKQNVEGNPCLVISEEKAPSFFKEYYAKTFFTTKCTFAPFFSNTIDDCFASFMNRINEVRELLERNDVNQPTQQILYRLSIVSAVAALDTLISDLVLYIATKSREAFLKTVKSIGIPAKNNVNLIERILRMWCDNAIDSAEQEVVDHILRKSYSSMTDIKNTLTLLYDISMPNDDNMEEIIRARHLIAHRNGRKKDGNMIVFTKEETISKVNRIYDFAFRVKDKILNESERMSEFSR
ncbi:MAG: hypothetical protein PUF62_04175 [Bacteroidales bacterium]|nr:hypothetical protein [Bacteroidales bacterium]